MSRCQWKNCKSNVLMDDYCPRHLKQTCSICWEKVPSTNSAKHKRLRCGHAYHLDCIINWFLHSDDCPVCRKPQKNDSIIQFKHLIETNLRRKYKEAIISLERENRMLRQIPN